MNNIVIVSQGNGKYLFSLPDNVALKEGDRVKCDTGRGITYGIAFADSAWVDENVSQLIGKLTGAKFPLKSVAGKLEYQPFEKPEDKPANKYEDMSNGELDREMCSRGLCHARDGWGRKHDCLFVGTSGCDVTAANRAEVIKYLLAEDAEAAPKPEDKPSEDKPEPIKLYCVKGGNCVTEGKIYEYKDGDVRVDGQDWDEHYSSYENFVEKNPFTSACLVPLVARPAKVGESFLIVAKNGLHIPQVEIGNIFVAAKKGAHFGGKYVDTANGNRFYDQKLEYLVLDGYHAEPEAEPEPEPKYFSGKVVCVSSGDECFTVGKMYEFINGEVKDDDGDARPVYADERFKSVEEWNSEYGMPIARFIEFKGEAHD